MVKPFDAATKQLVELCWKWPVLCGRSPQALLAKGEAKGREEGREEGEISNTRALILRLGEKHFGTPSAQTVERLNQTRDKARLALWADWLLEVERKWKAGTNFWRKPMPQKRAAFLTKRGPFLI